MAHETLKATIRQYIGPNGQNSITGQIMQDILIAMVDEYPNLSGYATRTWVQQQDYAPKEWVQQQGYAKESELSDYLPLDGGTLTGAVNFTNTYGSGSIFVDSVDYDLNITASNMIYLDAVRGVGVNGNVTATSFIKSGGTSAQFLKADGSVDGNSYLLSSGGTITGNLTVGGAVKFNSNLTFAYDTGIKFGTDNKVKITRDSSKLLIVDEAGNDIIIGDYDNTAYTSIINDLQGCPSNSAYILGSQTWYILNDGTAQFKSVSQTSDLRKKDITGDVPMNLYNVANAPLFKFTWKDEKKYSGQHIGSAAQYWQTVLPELVSIGRDADMTLAMQYDVIALASAITVAKTVVDHEARIRQLEEKIK